MEPEAPASAAEAPPPEALVIRTAREAAGMTMAQAAAASDGAVSATYWRDVERGFGGRRGKRVRVRASTRTLAAMARITGATPGQLADAQREDAARVLAEILRREDAPAEPPSGAAPEGDGRPAAFSPVPSAKALALFDGDVTKALIWEAGEIEDGDDELTADLMRILNNWRAGRRSRNEGTA